MLRITLSLLTTSLTITTYHKLGFLYHDHYLLEHIVDHFVAEIRKKSSIEISTLIREKAVDCCAKGNELFFCPFVKSAVHGHKYPVPKRQCIKTFASTARFLTR